MHGEQKYRSAERQRTFRLYPTQKAKGPRRGEDPPCKVLCICKPGSVPLLRGVSTIYLGPRSHAASIDLPSGIGRAALIPPCDGNPGIHGLSAHGVYQAALLTQDAVGSYPTFSPLPPPCDGSAVSVSAALSVAPPSPVTPLPVRKHGALRCPDFPPSGRSRRAMERCTGCQ